MISVLLVVWSVSLFARAEYSDWCSEATTYNLDLGHRLVSVRVGDGGRVCEDDVPAQIRPITRFSPTGGLTGVASYYAFFSDRVRLNLRHLKFRCRGGHECRPVRAGERCALVNPGGSVWSGAEAFWKELKPGQLSAPSLRLAFERVAWNALLGVAPAREAIADESQWSSFGLDDRARQALGEDLAFSKRHCAEIAAEPGGGLLSAGRVGVIEGERLVPLAESYDGRWNVSDTAFRSLYKKLDAGAAEVWALRTSVSAALDTHWRQVDGTSKPPEFDLQIPFLLTPTEVVARKGFFTAKTPLPKIAHDVRVITSLDGVRDPEKWQTLKKVPADLNKRGRDLFRGDNQKRFECMPSVDEAEGETMRTTAEPFTDRDLEVYRAIKNARGDVLVGVRARVRCAHPVASETGMNVVLQRHWYYLPKGGTPRLVTRAKDAMLAADLDGDGTSEWIFASVGVDEHPPYYYAFFDRKRGEVIEAH